MAHKVCIDGTAYEIDGGKAMVDGTVYEIDHGVANVDGTAYEVGFAPPAAEIILEKYVTDRQHYGDGDGDYCIVTVDGVEYEFVGNEHVYFPNLSVPVGTEIKVYLYKSKYGMPCVMYVEGIQIASVTRNSDYTYIHTVQNNTRIYVEHAYNSMVGKYIQVYITTEQ